MIARNVNFASRPSCRTKIIKLSSTCTLDVNDYLGRTSVIIHVVWKWKYQPRSLLVFRLSIDPTNQWPVTN